MKIKVFSATVTLLALAVALFGQSSLAHPPDDPYDNTVFAPIKDRSGIRIGLESVATGLTAPLKGVTAPGDRRLFVVDQTGTLWAIDLATGAKTVLLDVSDRLVPLGVFGPGSFDERGFLGVAFHPDYDENGLLYTYTSEPNAGPPSFPTTMPAGTEPDHQNVVAEWHVPNPDDAASVVDPASRRELMRVDWPQFNHDGGDLAFGRDGMLYISMGDGGGADDRDGQQFTQVTGELPGVEIPMVGHQGDGNAQKLNTPLGKILRIDVDERNSANSQYGVPADNPFFVGGAGLVQEIYAFGFRNPFRFSFDTRGRLFVGDVGQNDLEEVDIVRAGRNYGWNRREGAHYFHHNGNFPGFAHMTADPTVIIPPDLTDPIAEYDTHHEGHSVIGGYLYRGDRVRALRGRYVFGEYSRIFRFPAGPDNFGRILYTARRVPREPERLLRILEVKGFEDAAAALGLTDPARQEPFPQTLAVLGMAEDAEGELYVLGNVTGRPFGMTGVVLRIAPARDAGERDRRARQLASWSVAQRRAS